MVPRAIVFDVEGTLIDCVGLILDSWRETLDQAGHPFTIEQLQAYSGMDGSWMLERLLPNLSTAQQHGLLKAQGERYREKFIDSAVPFAGIRELFQELKRADIPIGIATTCQRDELASYDRRAQVMSLADSITCGGSVKHGKPDPALFRLCMRELAVCEPALAVAIGDTPYDAMAAQSAGMRRVGVLTGGFSESDLLEAGHEQVVEDVRGLQRLWRAD